MQCPMAIFVTIISMAIDKNNKSGGANSKNCYSAILFCIISKRGGTSLKKKHSVKCYTEIYVEIHYIKGPGEVMRVNLMEI